MGLKYYRQPPIKGGRKPLPSCVLSEIEYEVDRAAKKFKVSRSFVIATALADYFGVKEQPDFRKAEKVYQKEHSVG